MRIDRRKLSRGLALMRATLTIFLLLTATAMAGPRQDMLEAIARCNAIPDERLFLDCVYGAAQPVRAELGLPPAAATQQRLVPAITAPPTAPATTTTAGRSHNGLNLFDDSLHMTAYSFDGHGLFTVTLSDGSVWKQNPNDTNFAHFSGAASRYPVSIVAGEYGSRLDVRGEPGPYRVELVR